MKKYLIGVVTCVLLVVCCVGVYAATYEYNLSYNTSKSIYFTSMYNGNTYSKTYGLNTNPTQGKSGVEVKVYEDNGDYITSKQFPFYDSVSDLRFSIGSKKTYDIYLGPVRSGQTVAGKLYFDLG